MEIITKWKCGGCGMIWENACDAEECCQPDILEIKIYLCDGCSIEYETEKEAFECCNQTKITSQFK